MPKGVDEPEDIGVLSGSSGKMDSVTVLTRHGSSSRSTLGRTVDGGFRGLKIGVCSFIEYSEKKHFFKRFYLNVKHQSLL